MVESNDGKVFVAPTNSETEVILDRLSSRIGLRKREQGHTRYFMTRGSTVKAFRDFGWIVRRSWRNKNVAALWAVVHLGEANGWGESPLSLEAVAAVADCSRKQCAVFLEEAFSKAGGLRSVGGELLVDRQATESALAQIVSQLPTRTEEAVMRVLCSELGGSASEVYERVIALGLGMSTTYKTLEKLKKENYVTQLKHFRVNEKGPMRELLAANCGTCFYGYASPQRCFSNTFREMDYMLETYYGKKINDEDRDKLRSSIGAVPYSSKLSRRVCELLALAHRLDQLAAEGGVSTVLSRIEETYGMELPLRRQQG
jgi:hypothetical protein